MASNGIVDPKSKHEEIHPMLKALILANPTFDSIGDAYQIYPELKDQILAEHAFDFTRDPCQWEEKSMKESSVCITTIGSCPNSMKLTTDR